MDTGLQVKTVTSEDTLIDRVAEGDQHSSSEDTN